MQLTPQPRLVEQAHEAILGEIADGTLGPGVHLIQEALAAHYGVSRQPIQQALLLLKSEGLVEDAPGRGLVVAPLDLTVMRQRYEVRAALDGLAARLAAERCAGSEAVASGIGNEGERLVAAGLAAVAEGAVQAMVAADVAFHAFVYAASGNPMIGPSAEAHWRFLRRVMGEVLRNAGPPGAVWEQHRGILEAIVAGDAAAAQARALAHIQSAMRRLTETMSRAGSGNGGQEHHEREGNADGAGGGPAPAG